VITIRSGALFFFFFGMTKMLQNLSVVMVVQPMKAARGKPKQTANGVGSYSLSVLAVGC
jgi:hypothetical protein